MSLVAKIIKTLDLEMVYYLLMVLESSLNSLYKSMLG